MKILVTGGAGFIGSHFVRKLLTEDSVQKIVILDNLSYAGRRENMLDFINEPKVTFIEAKSLSIFLFSFFFLGSSFLSDFILSKSAPPFVTD